MCGLFGYAWSRLDRRTIPFISAVAALMDERGDDSWGYYAYPFKEGVGTLYDQPVYAKNVGTFCQNVPARVVARGNTMLMAHSRNATVGAATKNNAHPFVIGDFVGMHNGAIYNWKELNTTYKRKYEVDSMQIFAQMSEGQSLKELHGYGAAIWIRLSEPKKIHFVKWNEASTFAVATVKLKSGEPLGVAWASTEFALAQSLSVAGFDDYKMLDIKDEVAYYVEPNEKGVPTVYNFNKGQYKHKFGYKGSSTSFWGGTSTPSRVEAWCTTCHVNDDLDYHKNGKAHVKLQTKVDVFSEPERLLRTKVALEILEAYKRPEVKVRGLWETEEGVWKYDLVYFENDRYCQLELVEKDEPVPDVGATDEVPPKQLAAPRTEPASCLLCSGPGPLLLETTKDGALWLCRTCHGDLKEVQGEQRSKIIRGLFNAIEDFKRHSSSTTSNKSSKPDGHTAECPCTLCITPDDSEEYKFTMH
jgi:predicted glutamine amidotransferase